MLSRDIIIICGVTTSGKSDFAMNLCDQLHGDGVIINADSRQVYTNLPIITGQPTREEMHSYKHKLYDFLSPHHSQFNVAMWLHKSIEEIKHALSLGLKPIVVGGTALYISALVNGIARIPQISSGIIAEVEAYDDVYNKLCELDPNMASKLNPRDTTRIKRALAVYMQTGKSILHWQKMANEAAFAREEMNLIYINADRDVVYNRCDARFEKMIKLGAVDEVSNLFKCYKDTNLEHYPKILGLKEIAYYINGLMSYENMINTSKQLTRNYAKRQYTFFKNQFEYDYIIDHEYI